MFKNLFVFDNWLKYGKLFKPFRSATTTMQENRMTVRRELKSDTFDVQFKLTIDQLSLSREFNMKRKVDEPLELLMSRITTNMEKAFGKKLKKNKKGLQNNTVEEDNLVKITAEIRHKFKTIELTTSCERFFFDDNLDLNDVTFYFCDTPFKAIVNLPYVPKIALPGILMTGLPAYPLKFVVKFGSREKSSFVWYTSSDEGITWRRVGNNFTYKPTNDDVGRSLKLDCTPSDGTNYGDTVTALSTAPIQKSPDNLPHLKRNQYTERYLNFPQFRVVSYNILADKYAETETANTSLFPYCPDFARTWNYRRQLLVDELNGYNADIVCLQEVDTRAFEYDLTATLSDRYKGIFNKKFSVEEGVAIFFNKRRYKLLRNDSCYLNLEIDTNDLFADVWNQIKTNQSLLERLKCIGTVAQIVTLLDNDSSNRIVVVANTHLYFHPDADHIRLLQAGLFAKYFGQVVNKLKEERPQCSIALVVSGDFNSVPSCGIYRLYTTGVAPSDLEDWKSKEGEIITELELRQGYPLQSAYGTPAYTNYTKGFADCLDYIFYKADNLMVVNTVPLLSEEELKVHTALPSIVCPSDHMALVADMAWTDIH